MSNEQQARARGATVELWLWTILAVSLVLSAAHDVPEHARDASAVAAGLVVLALFTGRALQLLRAVA